MFFRSLFRPKPRKEYSRQRNLQIEDKIWEYQREINRIISTMKNSVALPDREMSEKERMLIIFPKADSRHCSACGADFGREVKRATTCPNCRERVIVRNGLVLTDKLISLYYRKSQFAYDYYHRFKDMFDSVKIKDAIFDRDYLEALFIIADYLLKLNRRDEGWRILNGDVMDVASGSRDWGRIYSARMDFIKQERASEGVIRMGFLFAMLIVDGEKSVVHDEYHDYDLAHVLLVTCEVRQTLRITKEHYLKLFDGIAQTELEKKTVSKEAVKLTRKYLLKNILRSDHY